MNVEGVKVISEQGIDCFVPCVPGKTSDGYHTFDELYEHRCILFAALLKAYPSRSWRSKLHDDGAGLDGWFIAGMSLPIALPDVGHPITYHLPLEMWKLLEGIPTLDLAPKWDGHTSQDVIDRLKSFVEGNVILGAIAEGTFGKEDS